MNMNLPSISGHPEAESAIKHEEREEVRKYVRMLPHVAEPNLARVREIREQIEKGTYFIPEMIEETASRLMFRFLRKE